MRYENDVIVICTDNERKYKIEFRTIQNCSFYMCIDCDTGKRERISESNLRLYRPVEIDEIKYRILLAKEKELETIKENLKFFKNMFIEI